MSYCLYGFKDIDIIVEKDDKEACFSAIQNFTDIYFTVIAIKIISK